jgi:hypothetical protein
MKQGALDLLSSERGTLCILLVLASTVLVIMGRLTADQWLTYTQWICVTLVASKTVTSAIYAMKKPTNAVPEARVVSEGPTTSG